MKNISFVVLAFISFPAFAQSHWGFSIASVEHYFPDSTHQEYCYFSPTMDISSLACGTIHTHTIDGKEREESNVLTECLSRWFFRRLKESHPEVPDSIGSERALVSQVEKYKEKGKACEDYAVQCLFASQAEAEKERREFMKRAKKLGAKVMEVL